MVSKQLFQKSEAYFLENDTLRVVVLPELGGKIASIYYKKQAFELLFQNPKDGFASATLGDCFAEHEACGFDDTFPSIDKEVVMVAGKEVTYPDHGEVWTSKCAVTQNEDSVTLFFHSEILPYSYKKTLSLSAENTLQMAYEIVNTGDITFPCLWTVHSLVNYREDMRLVYPPNSGKAELTSPNDLFVDRGIGCDFPIAKYVDGTTRDFTKVPPAMPPSAQKYYIQGAVQEGWCAYEYPSEKVRATLTYDEKVFPYLGFWITAGAFRGDYNCALEPATGYYDNIARAQKNNACPVLAPGETLEFTLEFSLDTLEA